MIRKIKKMFGVERLMFLDYETFSKIDIRKTGACVYAEHESAEILMGAYAFDNEAPRDWDKYALEMGDVDTPHEPPEEFLSALVDPTVLKIAHNVPFEYTVTLNILGIHVPHEQWMDAMVAALYLSFPGALDKIGKLVGLDEDKQKSKDGKKYIRTFTKPATPLKSKPDRVRIWPWDKPDDWVQFRAYNRQDVIALREITLRLMRYAPPMHVWAEWWECRAINERGIPVNKEMAENAMKMYDSYMEENLARLGEITGLANPNSRAQLLKWLHDSDEYVFDNLRKASVSAALREEHLRPENPDVVEALQLRRELSKTSVTKFRKFRDCQCEDGTIKQTLQFGGAARTLRWGGRLIQPHNLKKPSDFVAENMPMMANIVEHGTRDMLELMNGDAMNTLSETIRGTIQAPPGYVIGDADLSAIENVVLGYASNDQKILEVFRTGRDPYLSFAQYMYHQDYDVLWNEYKTLKQKKKRTVSKPAVLGCGYRLGAGHRYIDESSGEEAATGLIGYAMAMGIALTDEEAEESVKVWRATYKDAVTFWYDLERAAFDTLRTGRRSEVGPVSFDIKGKFLRLRLPSGRHLHYYKAHIRKAQTPWGEMRDNVHYQGQKESHWCLQSTHGGKFTENICQAIARDILQHGISLALLEGLDVFLHVHDQILILAPEDKAEEQLKILMDCMSQRPSWAPDIPLSTGGIITTHMSKD